MRVTIHQPSYWPWLGLLDKIAKSETLIVLDDVAANKASTQYRNQFYCGGIAKYVSLPVNYQKGIQLNRLEFKNNSWRDDHLNKLKNYYMKAPFFNEIFEAIQPMYVNNENETPFNFILNTMKLSFELLGINTKVLLSSSFESTSFKGDLVIDLCDRSMANQYVSGQGAKQYLDEEQLSQFDKLGIELIWHEFIHPKYPQNKKFDFVEGLSCLDILFWNGKEEAQKVFWRNVNG